MIMLMVYALILTLGVAVVDVFGKQIKKWWWYVVIFLLMLLGQWLFSDKAHADEYYIDGVHHEFTYEMTETAQKEIAQLKLWMEKRRYCKGLTGTQIADYQKKMKFHQENAQRTLDDAKARCWWLPDLTDRDNARYCWTSAIALLAPGAPHYKGVAVILNILLQYGLDCSDEWHYINEKLYWSQYHSEMADFYEEIIRKS